MTPTGAQDLQPRDGFVSFEGIEGCGKTTQIRRVGERLRRAGVPCLVTREPGGTELGRRLRGLLLDPNSTTPSAKAELLLYIADRAQHLEEVIVPALAAGRVVLCDRYVDATIAYQGFGRGLDLRWIAQLHQQPPLNLMPARTLLIDLGVNQALERAHARDRARMGDTSEGRFEAESLIFHDRVREGYLTIAAAEPQRVRVIAGDGAPEEVERRVVAALGDLLALETGS